MVYSFMLIVSALHVNDVSQFIFYLFISFWSNFSLFTGCLYNYCILLFIFNYQHLKILCTFVTF